MNLPELKKRIDALPRLRRAAGVKDRARHLLPAVRDARKKLEDVIGIYQNARDLLPGAKYNRGIDASEKAIRLAKRIHARLADSPEALSDAKFAEDFTLLAEEARRAYGLMEDAWNDSRDARIASRAPLAEALSKMGRSDGAVKALARVRGAAPPASPEEKKFVKKMLDELDAIVDRFEGPLGELLKAAASPEGADPKLLLDQEVQAALKENKMWDKLRLRI